MNGTISKLSLIPAVEDDNRMVTCRAQTPLLSGGFSEGELRMQVFCKYIVFQPHGRLSMVNDDPTGTTISIPLSSLTSIINWERNGNDFILIIIDK